MIGKIVAFHSAYADSNLQFVEKINELVDGFNNLPHCVLNENYNHNENERTKELNEIRKRLDNLEERLSPVSDGINVSNETLSVDLKRSRDNAVSDLTELYNERKRVQSLLEENVKLNQRIADITFQVGLHEIDKQSQIELALKKKIEELERKIARSNFAIENYENVIDTMKIENESLKSELKLLKK